MAILWFRRLPKPAICVYLDGFAGRQVDFSGTLKKGFLNGLSLTVDMIKVIVPFYLIVESSGIWVSFNSSAAFFGLS